MQYMHWQVRTCTAHAVMQVVLINVAFVKKQWKPLAFKTLCGCTTLWQKMPLLIKDWVQGTTFVDLSITGIKHAWLLHFWLQWTSPGGRASLCVTGCSTHHLMVNCVHTPDALPERCNFTEPYWRFFPRCMIAEITPALHLLFTTVIPCSNFMLRFF